MIKCITNRITCSITLLYLLNAQPNIKGDCARVFSVNRERIFVFLVGLPLLADFWWHRKV